MPEDRHVFTMRIDSGLVKRIDRMNDRRFHVAGGKGKPPVLNRSETIRWLLNVGLEEVEKDLDRREEQSRRDFVEVVSEAMAALIEGPSVQATAARLRPLVEKYGFEVVKAAFGKHPNAPAIARALEPQSKKGGR